MSTPPSTRPGPAAVTDAGLGWRFAAVVVDSIVLFVVLVVIFAFAAANGALDLQDPAFSGGFDLNQTAPSWAYPVAYGLVFVYYTLLEALLGASIGKLVFRMRVTMDDGSRPTGLAIVVRNVVRLPEVLFWYVPAAISCLASSRNKRLGDLAAHTVVVRLVPDASRLRAMPAAPAAPAAGAPANPVAARPGGAPDPPPALGPALRRFKRAALALRGAHVTYLYFSESELAAGPRRDELQHDYSAGYTAAWYTLADAVTAAQKAQAAAEAAALREGTTLAAACADKPDLAHLSGALEPYLTAVDDEDIHAAYLAVARDEAGAAPTG
jgi:uncharacterized RDD family membrane protein YckC